MSARSLNHLLALGIGSFSILLSTNLHAQEYNTLWGDDRPYEHIPIHSNSNAPPTPALEDLDVVTNVTHFDITWHFSGPVRMGKFVNGEKYVVGACTVIDITPKPLFGQEVLDAGWVLISPTGAVRDALYTNQWARNRSMKNPPLDLNGSGYDSRTAFDRYKPNYFLHLPVNMEPGDVLVSTVSEPSQIRTDGHGKPVKFAGFLTCLSEPQPADAFRPSYGDRSQKIYLARNLRRHLLFRLPRPAVTPSVREWIHLTRHTWLDIMTYNFDAASRNSSRYGQGFTYTFRGWP